jgi:hypothetical protein
LFLFCENRKPVELERTQLLAQRCHRVAAKKSHRLFVENRKKSLRSFAEKPVRQKITAIRPM